MNAREPLTRSLLIGAMLVPLLYFGVQVVLVPLFPDYDLQRNPTSLLGADIAPYPAVFNSAAIAAGICALVGAAGIFRAARDGGSAIWVAGLLALAIALMGFGSIWAGWFPLPDPRHGATPLGPVLLAAAPVFALAGWLVPPLWPLRIYLTINLVLFAAVALVMARLTPIDPAEYGGYLQRIAAAIFFLPIGIMGWRLRRT